MMNCRGAPILRCAVLCLSFGAFALAFVCADVPPSDLKAPFNADLRFTPEHDVDFEHVRIAITPDWTEEKIRGEVSHKFRALRDDTRTIKLDAMKMTVSQAKDSRGRELVRRVLEERIEIDLAEPLARGAEETITIEYECRPELGVYFIQAIDGYPERRPQVWTQGESEDARHWFPCFDHPSERLTSEILVTVPSTMTVIANGTLVEKTSAPNGAATFHWRLEQPHVSYLVAFAAGEFESLSDSWDGIPLKFWCEKADLDKAKLSFAGTKEMLGFFSEKFGRYPWPKYDQVVVRDFIVGGMENTTCTLLNMRTLHEPRDEPSTRSTGLAAHELAHQWFGDLVTCRDWSDIWLNESFATFSATLFKEATEGMDEAQLERLEQLDQYLGEDRDRYRRPIVCRSYKASKDVFDRHVYPKGARVLEMLRREVGDQAFFESVQLYLKRNAHESVATSELLRAFEDTTGAGLERFFDQWVHHGGHPVFEVRQEYEADKKRLRLEVKQTQPVDRVTPLFHVQVEIGLYGAGGEEKIERIEVTRPSETFNFDCPWRPLFVRFDRRGMLIMECRFEKPLADWIAQLARDPDVLGRVEAARKLGDQFAATADPMVESALAGAMGHEKFWGVRREIVRALAKGRTLGAFGALESALKSDPDARVRESAAAGLGDGRASGSLAAVKEAFDKDANDWVKSAALRAAYDIDNESGWQLTAQAAKMTSHQERIRTSAIDIIERAARPESVARLLELAASGLPHVVRVRALEGLGRLGRGHEEARRALLAGINDPHAATRRQLYATLSRLGGDEVRTALERQRTVEWKKPMREALDSAISGVDAPETVEQLAKELRELREKNLSLEKRVEELEKKQE